MKLTAEQLALFEIEPADSVAIVITSTTSTMIKTKNFSLNMWTYGGGWETSSSSTTAPSFIANPLASES